MAPLGDDPGTIDTVAERALAAIDARTHKVVHQLERAIAVFVGNSDTSRAEVADGRVLAAHDLELAVASWKDLVPSDPGAKAAVIHAVVQRSGLSSADYPMTAAALGVGDPDVDEVFLARYGADVATAASGPTSRPQRDVGSGTGLSLEQLVDFEGSFSRVVLEAGEVLFRQGDLGDSLYVVVTGRVRMLAGEPGHEHALGELGPGELLGEMALLTGEPRAATIVAVRDSELYRLGSESVEHHLFTDVGVMRRMMTTLARRLAGTASASSAEQSSVRSVALVPAGDTPVGEVSRFAETLGRFLAHHVRVRVLDAPRVEDAVGPGATGSKEAAASTGLSGWLSDQEDRHDILLYAPGGDEHPARVGSRGTPEAHFWERLCVRQADVVLLVGRAGADPRPGPAEGRLLSAKAATGARRELVLLHSHRGARSWGPSNGWTCVRLAVLITWWPTIVATSGASPGSWSGAR